MAKHPKEQLKKGVICSSAGNRAEGVALAARKLNCDAVIAMPYHSRDQGQCREFFGLYAVTK